MERKYWLFTILRNGIYKTVVDQTNPVIFLITEKELWHETFILNQIELTKQEYDFYTKIKTNNNE